MTRYASSKIKHPEVYSSSRFPLPRRQGNITLRLWRRSVALTCALSCALLQRGLREAVRWWTMPRFEGNPLMNIQTHLSSTALSRDALAIDVKRAKSQGGRRMLLATPTIAFVAMSTMSAWWFALQGAWAQPKAEWVDARGRECMEVCKDNSLESVNLGALADTLQYHLCIAKARYQGEVGLRAGVQKPGVRACNAVGVGNTLDFRCLCINRASGLQSPR
jgi:hypothetical protein